MLNRIIYALLALASAVVLTFGIVPKIIGMGVRDATITNVFDLIPPESRSQLTITEGRFDNGWFRSTGIVTVTYNPLGLGQSMTMQLDFDIVHGPLLLTADGARFGLAYAEIFPSFDNAELSQLMAEMPFELPEARLDLFAGFDQSLEIGFEIAPLNISDAEGQLVFDGLNGSLVANADLSAEFLFSMGRLQANASSNQFGFSVAGMELQSSTERMDDLLAPSVALLAIPAISSSGPLPFDINGISADSRISPSTAGAQQIDIYQHFSVASIQSDLPLASLSWTSEINEIHGDLIRRYYTLLAEVQNQISAGGGVNAQVTELGQELGVIMIQNSLVFNNLVEANAFDGDHSVDLRVRWAGLPQLDNVANLDINEAIAALTIQLNVSLDQAAIGRSPLAEMVDPYVQQGYIRIDNGRLLMEGSLNNGELTLNGEQVPLDQFF